MARCRVHCRLTSAIPTFIAARVVEWSVQLFYCALWAALICLRPAMQKLGVSLLVLIACGRPHESSQAGYAILQEGEPATIGANVRDQFASADTADVVIAFRDVGSDPVAIRGVGRDIVATLGDEFVLRHRYQFVPAVAGAITPRGLVIARELGAGIGVDLDRWSKPNMAEVAVLTNMRRVTTDVGLTGEGVTIAMVDTGVDLDHPDLIGTIADEHCICSDGCCPNGAAVQTGPGSAEDQDGHGTAMAGIMAGQGVVAPPGAAANASIVAVRVAGPGGNSRVSDDIAALDWILARSDIDVVLYPRSGSPHAGICDDVDATTQAYAVAVDALKAKGVALLGATGNGGSGTEINAPACVESAISVGATWDSVSPPATVGPCTEPGTIDLVACLGNSNIQTDLLAPGIVVTTTELGGGSTVGGGTSLATAVATGCAALLLEYDPSLTVEELRQALTTSPTLVTDPKNGVVLPRLDCRAALRTICSLSGCVEQDAQCGVVDDGCAGVFECGDCIAPETCGGGGVVNQCGCTPTTCAAQGAQCGTVDDGCGGTLDCGSCTAPATCGGGGVANECGCTPTTCVAQGAQCGHIGNGCGASIECGSCTAPATCGGGGFANQCGCTPTTCVAQGAACGTIDDGCGGVVECGDCISPATCGGGGVANQCGCMPTTCAAQGAQCGTVDDGCGSTLDCGSCIAPATCGGGGLANECGCTPTSCAAQGAECGVIEDGCGGTLECGGCTARGTCGGDDMANRCSCTATTCHDEAAQCGTIDDGCGGLLECGVCPAPNTCTTTPDGNRCACAPTTCRARGAECGVIDDGCGRMLDCGTCADPDSCGRAGEDNQCGQPDRAPAAGCAAHASDPSPAWFVGVVIVLVVLRKRWKSACPVGAARIGHGDVR